MSRRLYNTKVAKIIKSSLITEFNKEVKNVQLISFSLRDLKANLGNDQLAEKIYGNLVNGIDSLGTLKIGNSIGKRINSVQRLQYSDVGNIGRAEHLFYLNKSTKDLVVITRSSGTAKTRLKNILNSIKQEEGLSKEDSDSMFALSPSRRQGVNLTEDTGRLVEIKSEYQIRSAGVISLTKRISNFTTDISIVVPQNLNLSSNLMKNIEQDLRKEIAKTNSEPVRQYATKLAQMLNYMDEKNPRATAKAVADVVIRESVDRSSAKKTFKARSIKTTKSSREAKELNSSLARTLTVLNKNLERYIRGRMKSKLAPLNKNYLRNQTGRFARSVFISGLAVTPRTITAYYNFQNYPYDVFDPLKNTNSDDKRPSKGRSPATIIRAGIRDAVRERLFANKQNIVRNIISLEAD